MPTLVPGYTDARHFAQLGIQTYGFLPMRLPPHITTALIHAPDERVPPRRSSSAPSASSRRSGGMAADQLLGSRSAAIVGGSTGDVRDPASVAIPARAGARASSCSRRLALFRDRHWRARRRSLAPGSEPSPLALADIPADYLSPTSGCVPVRDRLGDPRRDREGRVRPRPHAGWPAATRPARSTAPGRRGPMQFLGSTWRRGTPPMAVPAVGPPTATTCRRVRDGRRRRRVSPTSGTRPTRSPAPPGCSARTERPR